MVRKRNEAKVVVPREKDPGTDTIIEKLVKASENRPEAAVGIQVQWVFRNLPKNWDQIDPDNVPDPGSVELLRWAKSNPGIFYQSYHVRFLPSKTEVDRHAMARGSDDDLNRVDAVLLDALERARAKREDG